MFHSLIGVGGKLLLKQLRPPSSLWENKPSARERFYAWRCGGNSNSRGRNGPEAVRPVRKLRVTWPRPETREDPGAGSRVMAR